LDGLEICLVRKAGNKQEFEKRSREKRINGTKGARTWARAKTSRGVAGKEKNERVSGTNRVWKGG